MKISCEKKSISVPVKEVDFFGRFFGLMFKPRNTHNLLFHFRSSEYAAIHSFFVFFTFVAVWLDDRNRIVACDIVKPFTPYVAPKKLARKLVEIPFNKRNSKIIRFLVGKRKI